MRIFLLFIAFMALTGCTREQIMRTTGQTDFSITSRFAVDGLAPLPGSFTVAEGQGFNQYRYTFKKRTEGIWGESIQNNPSVFVKYTNGYRNRVMIDFGNKKITVSTVNSVDPVAHLQKAITTILLAPLSPEKVDIYSDRDIELGGQPFLLGRVKDSDGKDIKWQWRAKKYAQSLTNTALEVEQVKFRKAYSVSFRFDGQQEINAPYKYKSIVKSASEKYGIPEDLIYGIIKTESSFNPFAVSHAGAFGLMQVVPRTAGADVFRLIKGKSGKPTRKQLFDPAFNIDIGTAYLTILRDRYLKGISDPVSLEYGMISAYNGGAGGVFRAFGTRKPKEAKAKINSMSPAEVFDQLKNKHPFAEARGYIVKVSKNRKL
ncbi:murein transglycosylase domain-containing protein [Vibrio owensii]|uniref:murein transglycosylase domain-containing protein n=1 Tax=Vibrio owensii TaxID=696485 RepID=UPI0018F19C58|nr:murein transglycosylase domain-containing protein [Vibrio owensii]